MRSLLRVGLSLLVLAFVLIGLSYSVLRAQGVSTPAEGRALASETRSVDGAIRIVELSGPIDLTLRHGAKPSLLVRGEQRLLGNIETVQDGELLHIGTRGIVLRHRRPLEVELVLPALTRISVSGSGKSSVNGFSGERIEVQLDGSGRVRFNGRFKDVTAALHGSGDLDLNAGASIDRVQAELMGSGDLKVVGTARELHADVTGSGDFDARHLRADTVSLKKIGSGNSDVHARNAVSASLSGSGDVTVHGKPDQRAVSRSGSGDIRFDD